MGLVPGIAQAQAPDSWTPERPVLDRADMFTYVSGIHATLMPDQTVMLFGFTQNSMAPCNILARSGSTTFVLDPTLPPTLGNYLVDLYPEAVDPNYASTTYCPPEVQLPSDCARDSYFCSGHTLLSDGRVFVAGGLRTVREFSAASPYSAGGGVPYGGVWNGAGWVQTPLFDGTALNPHVDLHFQGNERYYPTAMRYIDGRVLVTSGTQLLGATGAVTNPVRNLTAEFYDPSVAPNGSFTEVTDAVPGFLFNSDYTHSFVLPSPVADSDVIMIGESGQPGLFDANSGTFGPALAQRPGSPATSPNKGASTLMLPIRVTDGEFGYSNGSILCAGGQPSTLPPGFNQGAGDNADIFDVASGAWLTNRIPLDTSRHHPATVLLPDAEIAVIGGHVPGVSGTNMCTGVGTIQLDAEYINLRGQHASVGGNPSPGPVTRGYHMSAVLLPDGRVMVTGGRSSGANSAPIERASVQFLSPPYMAAGNRPTITLAPDQLVAGDRTPQVIQAQAAEGIAEVVLMALGSMTHSVDMNQRYVELEFVPGDGGGGQTGTILPPSVHEAPPGYYMLFVLNGQLTPSVAKIIRVV